MTKPENFISSSDYATLKNDAEATFTFVLPGSLVIAGGDTYDHTSTTTVGVAGATERVQIHSSKESVYWPANIVNIQRFGVMLGSSVPYSILVELFRSAPTQLTARVQIFNPYSDPLTTEAGAETFTFSVATFVPPFS